MNAVDLLTQDHRKVEGIFQQLQQGDGAQNQQLLAQLYQELSLHALAEENVFYPSLASDTSMSGQLKDSFKEHGEMKAILGELAALGNGPEGLLGFNDRLTALQKAVEHHVKDEETKVFPEARQVLGDTRLQSLGQQITQAKQLSMPAVQASVPAQELGVTGNTIS